MAWKVSGHRLDNTPSVPNVFNHGIHGIRSLYGVAGETYQEGDFSSWVRVSMGGGYAWNNCAGGKSVAWKQAVTDW